MPTVRTYGQLRVGTAPLPGVRKSAGATAQSEGAGLADAQGRFAGAEGNLALTKGRAAEQTNEALAGVGGTIAQVGGRLGAQAAALRQQEQDAHDETAVLDFDRLGGEWEHVNLNDPETGVLHTVKGKDAVDLAEKLGAAYDTYTGSLMATLTPRQRAMAQRTAAGRRAQITERLDAYGAQQDEAYTKAVTTASLQTSQSLAVANFDQPERVHQELFRQEQIITAYAAKAHVPDEVRDAQLSATRTITHKGIIQQYLAAGEVKKAAWYFDEKKDQINGDERAGLQTAVKVGTVRADAQQATASILAAGGTLAEQRKRADAITDPEVQDEVKQRLEHEAVVVATATRAAEESTLRSVYDVVERAGTVDAISPAVWASLDGGQRSALRSYTTSLAAGKPIQTDPGELYTLLTLSSTDPEKWLTTNLLAYKGSIGATDLERLMRKQAGDRTGKPTPDLFVTESVQNEIVDAGLTEMGLNLAPADIRKTPGLQGRIDAFRRSVREAVERTTTPGKKPTRAEVQSVVDTLIAPTQQAANYWFAADQPARFAYETAQAQVATVQQVPPAERQKIEASLRGKHVPVDDATILRMFNLQLSRVRGDR